jgi:ribonuclease PH
LSLIAQVREKRVATDAACRVSGMDPKNRLNTMRPSLRKLDEMRAVSIETDVIIHAEGSCLITVGGTKVLCTASLEAARASVPEGDRPGLGDRRIWHAAPRHQYPQPTRGRAAVPAGPHGRNSAPDRAQPCGPAWTDWRWASGRSPSTAMSLQADGGTRCAAITGGWVALRLAVNKLMAASFEV